MTCWVLAWSKRNNTCNMAILEGRQPTGGRSFVVLDIILVVAFGKGARRCVA